MLIALCVLYYIVAAWFFLWTFMSEYKRVTGADLLLALGFGWVLFPAGFLIFCLERLTRYVVWERKQ